MAVFALPPRAGTTFLVAASNAPDATKERADFVCSGSGDAGIIQAAINALPVDGEDRRGTIELSEGDYSIGQTILLPGHTQLRGAGWGTKLLATSGLNGYMIQLAPHVVSGSEAIGAEGIVIADLFLDYNGPVQTAGGHIDGYGARLCMIEHCSFHRPYDAAILWRALSNGATAHHNRVTNCFFDGGSSSAGMGCALSLTGSSENAFTYNTLQSMGGSGTNGSGVYDNAGLNLYQGNRFVGCNQALVIANQQGCRIVGNIFDGGTGDQLLMNGTNHVVTGNTFCNVGVSGTANTAHAINMSSACTGCSITSNVFSNDGGHPETFVKEATTLVGNNVIALNNFQITGAGISFLAILRSSVRSSIIRNNIGYVTESKGTAAIAAGQTSVVVTHGLSITPGVQDIEILSTSNNPTFYVFSNSITSTSFTISIPSAAPAGNAFFAWHATIL